MMEFQECIEKQENEKAVTINGDAESSPHNFIVSTAFQKYGGENTNMRIYNEHDLKKEAENYMAKINESCAIGELNHASEPFMISLRENPPF